MNAEQRLYCQDILERIKRIEKSISKGREAYARSYEIRDAVILSFIVIGEATKNLDAALKEQHPNINWRGIAGFRDILIHQYHSTEIFIAWQASQEDLPALKAAIIALLESLDDSESGS